MMRVLIAICVLMWASAAHAATYYVATNGDNSRSCATAQNINFPKQTLNNAVGCLTPGDTLLVRAGTYTEAFLNGAVPAGNSSNHVRIAAYPGSTPYETVWMKPSSGTRVMDFAGSQQYIDIDAINIDAEFMTNDGVKINAVAAGNTAHHMRFSNLTILGPTNCQAGANTGCHLIVATQLATGLEAANEFVNITMSRHPGFGDDFSHGFYLNSHDNIIDHCVIDGSSGWSGNGVQIFNGNGVAVATTPQGNTVKYCIITNITGSGRRRGIEMGFQSGTSKIYGNLIYGIGGTLSQSAGIRLEGTTQEIYNNTIYGSTRHGILVEGGSGHIIRNNIAYGNSVSNYEITGGSVSASSNNYGDTETGWTSLASNPFVDVSSSNFRLQSGAAPINNGTGTAPISTLVTVDLDGTSRPQDGAYDAGAYEFVTTPSTGPTVTIHGPTTSATYATTATELSGPEALSGIASDDTSVASCSWHNNATGQTAVTNGTTSWSVTQLPLAAGVINGITVTCLDGAGNAGSDSIGVTAGTQVQRYQLRIKKQ